MQFSENKYSFLMILALFLFGTQSANGQDTRVLDNSLKAHGGAATWQSFQSLSFDLVRGDDTQQHLINLNSRKTRQSNSEFTIGYDGTNVWVAPDTSAFPGNPSFFNGLYFYFFAMPFVFADPGVNAEFLGQREIGGMSYNVVEFSYDDGVGGSPKDVYLGHFDPATNQLGLLLYTVTFSSGIPSTNYNAMVYNEWEEVQGLLVPTRLTSHPWDKEKEELGAARGSMEFKNIVFDTSAPQSSLFEKPAEATYAN